MIIPPIFGAIQSVRGGLEKRYIASYLALTGMYNTSSKKSCEKYDVPYSDRLFFSFFPKIVSQFCVVYYTTWAHSETSELKLHKSCQYLNCILNKLKKKQDISSIQKRTGII